MSADQIPTLPIAWSWSRFDEIGSVSLGRQRSPANHVGPLMRPYVRAANVTWTGLDLADVKEMNFDANDFARFRLLPGDVLINEGSGSAAEVGKPAIWRGEIADCCFQNTLLRVQPKACSSEFVYNYLKSCARSGQFVPSTQGVNIFHIGREGLARHAIPVPPMPEQHRIVAKIDSLSEKANRARGRLSRLPVLIRKYKQAVLKSAFEGALTQSSRDIHKSKAWESKKITEIATNIFDGPFGSNLKSSDYAEGGTRVIRLENIGHMIFKHNKETYISQEKFDRLQSHRLMDKDILFSSFVDEEVRVCLFDITKTGSAINKADCFCIRVNQHFCIPEFVMLQLASSQTYATMKKKVHGATRPRINLSQIKEFQVLLPSRDEQKIVVEQIKKAFGWIDRLSTEAVSAHKLINYLDQAILTKAFRGELVPQDPNDEPASVLLEQIKAERVDGASVGKRRGRPPRLQIV